MILKNKKQLLVVAILTILLSVAFAYILIFKQNNNNLRNESNTHIKENIVDEQNPISQYDIDSPDSQYIVVNKNRPINLEYAPSDLIMPNIQLNNSKSNLENSVRSLIKNDLEKLFAEAQKNNLDIMLASGYRSSELQNFYYTNLVNSLGQEQADKLSAIPGTSEHQTGLSVDIANANRECYLEECFSESPAGFWLRNNAHNYGFIVRYPQGKESITGYQFEPWHFRYVGNELAQKLYTDNQTLEEYFNIN